MSSVINNNRLTYSYTDKYGIEVMHVRYVIMSLHDTGYHWLAATYCHMSLDLPSGPVAIRPGDVVYRSSFDDVNCHFSAYRRQQLKKRTTEYLSVPWYNRIFWHKPTLYDVSTYGAPTQEESDKEYSFICTSCQKTRIVTNLWGNTQYGEKAMVVCKCGAENTFVRSVGTR